LKETGGEYPLLIIYIEKDNKESTKLTAGEMKEKEERKKQEQKGETRTPEGLNGAQPIHYSR
jgi:hypothetical protein